MPLAEIRLTNRTWRTQGVKYAGSKLKLLPHILELASRVDAQSVFDAFSGTTRVSQALAQSGYRVICNDRAVWSKMFATCYLKSRQSESHYRELIAHLNSLSPMDGWYTEHYGGQPNGGSAVQEDNLKKPWQNHNTQRLDAIRTEIDRLDLNEIDKAVALTSLMLALDKVDSTIGHFVSYLKEWSPRSYKELQLEVPDLFVNDCDHEVMCQDVFELLPIVSADLAYLDPPYGSNNVKMPPSRVRYSSYYHIWTTICLNDRPALFGKAKRRADSSDVVSGSVFEDYRKGPNGRFIVVDAINELIASAKVKWIILSYSSGGRATAEELDATLREHGTILDIVEIDHKRNVMADMRWTDKWLCDAEKPNREFLFLVEKH